MVKLNINLDDSLKRYVDEEIARGRFGSADELVAASIAALQSQNDDDPVPVSPEVEELLLEALNDPTPPTVWSDEDFEKMKRDLVEQHNQKIRQRP